MPVGAAHARSAWGLQLMCWLLPNLALTLQVGNDDDEFTLPDYVEPLLSEVQVRACACGVLASRAGTVVCASA